MKIKLAILGTMLLLVLGCSDSPIDIVKNGKLDFDKSTTVGNAFDNYPYFKSTSWETFDDQQKRTIVQFKGSFDLIDLAKEEIRTKAPAAYFPVNYAEVLADCIDDKGCYLYSANYYFVVQFLITGDQKFRVGFIGFQKNNDEPVKTPVQSDIQRLYNGQSLTRAIATDMLYQHIRDK